MPVPWFLLISTEEADFYGGGWFLRRRLISTNKADFYGEGPFLRRRLISTDKAHFYRGGQFLCNRLTQESITWSVQLPYWAYVTAFSQNGLFLDLLDLFAVNRILELAWVILSMKRKEKKGGPKPGTSSYQNYANSAFLLLYSSIPILPLYLTILCKFFTLAKKFAGVQIIVLFLSCLHLKNLHPHSP